MGYFIDFTTILNFYSSQCQWIAACSIVFTIKRQPTTFTSSSAWLAPTILITAFILIEAVEQQVTVTSSQAALFHCYLVHSHILQHLAISACGWMPFVHIISWHIEEDEGASYHLMQHCVMLCMLSKHSPLVAIHLTYKFPACFLFSWWQWPVSLGYSSLDDSGLSPLVSKSLYRSAFCCSRLKSFFMPWK